jgi:beta-N-acetylhexosaminidase
MRKAILLTLVVPVLQVLTYGQMEAQNHAFHTVDSSSRRWVQTTLKHLSVEQKIGQMLQVRVYGDYRDFNDPAYRLVADQIQKYHIGSVDLGARMLGPNLVKGTPAQVATITNQLQRISEVPLLVGSDIERG